MNPILNQWQHEDNLRTCFWCGEERGMTTFDVEPPTTGEIYYWSRSWPRRTKSFFYEYDRLYMDRGRQVLGETRQHFLDDELPPRPQHFQWSVGPCGQCDYKPFCRVDAGLEPRKRKPTLPIVTKLSESNGIAHARSMRPHYDLGEVRDAVLKEWAGD